MSKKSPKFISTNIVLRGTLLYFKSRGDPDEDDRIYDRLDRLWNRLCKRLGIERLDIVPDE